MGFISPTASLRFALLVMGFSATASQILIVRELLITFHGNELFIGIIFGNWLILEALGSYYTRKRAEHTRRHVSSFAILQISVGLSSVLGIIFIRSFKYLFGISIGEVLGIPYVVIISLIALAPIAMLDGSLFPFGCRNLSAISAEEQAPARVYLYQAGGSFVAGLAFVFYLIHYLNPIQIATIILFLNLLSVIFYLTSLRESGAIRNSAMGIIFLTVISLFSPASEWVHKKSSELLWYEYPLMDTRNSVYANISVIKQEEEYTFFANGSPYATTPVPEAIVEEVAHFPMLFHEKPDTILLIGGAGGLLREVLRHPVERIDYAEQDPLIIESFRRFSTPLTEYELGHEKVKIRHLEGRLFLKKTKDIYDLIMVNMPIPSTLQLNRYYTVEFFEIVCNRLKYNGIFSVTLPGSETFLSKELKDLNRTIHASIKRAFPHVRVIIGERNIFIASKDEYIKNIGDEDLIKRLQIRRIDAGLMNEEYIRYKMDRERFGRFVEEITIDEEVSNHDTKPRGVFNSMLFLNLAVSPFMVKILYAIDKVPFSYYLIFIVIMFTAFIMIQNKQRGHMYINIALASTGFMSMFVSILLILYFQIYYGYVYHYIGLLTSLFMLGMAAGAFLIIKRVKTKLLSIELLLLLLTVLIYIFSLMDIEEMLLQQIIIYSLMTLSGFLTGMEYPVAVNLSAKYNRGLTTISGRLYAIDLFGAYLGAIIPAVILIPSMGIKNALLLLIIIKAGSMFLVYIGEK